MSLAVFVNVVNGTSSNKEEVQAYLFNHGNIEFINISQGGSVPFSDKFEFSRKRRSTKVSFH